MAEAEVKSGPLSNWKAAGIGGGIVASLMVLQPVFDTFYTRREGVSVEKSVADLRVDLKDFRLEMKADNAQAHAQFIEKLDNLSERLLKKIETDVADYKLEMKEVNSKISVLEGRLAIASKKSRE